MKVSSLAVLGVAILLVLAGCGAPGAQTNGSPTTTASVEDPNQTTSPSPPDEGGATFPPGTNRTGIVNGTLVIETHVAAMANESYAFTATQRAGPEGQQIVTLRSDPDQQVAHAISEGSGQLAATQLYIDNSTVYLNRSVQGTPQYGTQPLEVEFAEQHRRQLGSGYIRAILDAGTYAFAGTIERDGLEIYVFHLEEYRGGGPFPENATETTGTVRIDARGVVRSAHIFVANRTGETADTAEVEYRVFAVGNVTVEEPAWVVEARNGTDTSG